MEGLVIVLIIVLLILVVSVLSNARTSVHHLEDIRRDLRHTHDRLSGIEKAIADIANAAPREAYPQREEIIQKAPEPVIVETVVPVSVPELPDFPVITEEPQHEEPAVIPTEEALLAAEEAEWDRQRFFEPPVPVAQKEEVISPAPKPKRSIDLEKYIGENIVNKIGIGILVLGIGFFVKYAIDKDWINESFRVLIGLVCGGLLIGLAHRMHKEYKAFSSVLIGGGLAIFYLTIAIAFHEYKLMSQAVAFSAMVGITGLSVGLSLFYNRQEVAVLAIIGGFGTPFFVSTGSGNYLILLTYILILNVGMMLLAAYRRWPLLNILAYIFTVLIYGGWYATHHFYRDAPAYSYALLFAALYFLTFFGMNIAYNIRHGKKLAAFDFSILLSNSFLFYLAGMLALGHIREGSLQGLFTASLAVFNLGAAFALRNISASDKQLRTLLTGLVILFVSLVAPVQLYGSYITMYWAAEAALILWLAQRSGILLLKIGSMIITALMLFSLLFVWITFYGDHTDVRHAVLLNKGFITGCFSIISLGVIWRLLRNEGILFVPHVPASAYGYVIRIAFFALLFLVPLMELNHHVNKAVPFVTQRAMILSLYVFLFAAAFIRFAEFRKNKDLQLYASFLGALMLFAYAVIYTPASIGFRRDMIEGHTLGIFPFYAVHLPALSLIVYILYTARRNGLRLTEAEPNGKNAIYWVSSFLILYMSSTELQHLAVFCFFKENVVSHSTVLFHVNRIGFPIVWGVCALLFMRSGMREKVRALRIISLSVLLITILKLFLVDLNRTSEIGKIIAFICLGVFLLIISFMYQKIKRLIFDDDDNNTAEDKTGETEEGGPEEVVV